MPKIAGRINQSTDLSIARNQNVAGPEVAMQQNWPWLGRQPVWQFGNQTLQPLANCSRHMAQVGTQTAFGPELGPILGPGQFEGIEFFKF